MTTELAIIPQRTIDPYTPTSIAEAKELATMYAASRLLGPSYGTPQQVLLVMATGAELGISATAALRGIYVVEGRVYMSADLMVALVMRSPNCQRFDLVEASGERAVYEVQRKGGKPCRFEFTAKDAQRVGSKGPAWSKYPATMMRHRAASEACRAVFPDVLLGVYSEEEREEIQGGSAVPQRIAPETVQPVRTADPVVEHDAQDWPDRFLSVNTLPELTALAAEFKRVRDTVGKDVRDACGVAYKQRKAELTAPIEVEPPAFDAVTGEVEDREPGDEG